MRKVLFFLTAVSLGSACSDTSQAAPDAAAADLAVSADMAPPGADLGRDYSTDRSTFFGASRCAAANLQLCEDFESGVLDPATWTVSGTKPVIDGVQHARGSKALHIMIDEVAIDKERIGCVL